MRGRISGEEETATTDADCCQTPLPCSSVGAILTARLERRVVIGWMAKKGNVSC